MLWLLIVTVSLAHQPTIAYDIPELYGSEAGCKSAGKALMVQYNEKMRGTAKFECVRQDAKA